MDAYEQGDTTTPRAIGGTGSPTGRTRRCPPLLLVPLAPLSMPPKPKRHSRQTTKVVGVGGKDYRSRPGRARSARQPPQSHRRWHRTTRRGREGGGGGGCLCRMRTIDLGVGEPDPHKLALEVPPTDLPTTALDPPQRLHGREVERKRT